MTPDEACKRIIFHSQPEPGAFLEMLRPYGGLREDILIDLKGALRAAAPVFAKNEVPRELAAALWAISHLGRSWALEPGGMLRSNHLISDADLARLDEFLHQFGYAVFTLFDGAFDEAFADWPDP